jgi:hypothetical protein
LVVEVSTGLDPEAVAATKAYMAGVITTRESQDQMETLRLRALTASAHRTFE